MHTRARAHVPAILPPSHQTQMNSGLRATNFQMMKLSIICPRLLSSGSLTDGRPLVLVQPSDARLWHAGHFIACARPMPYYCAAAGCVPACAAGCHSFCTSKILRGLDGSRPPAAGLRELPAEGARRSCCRCPGCRRSLRDIN